MSQESQRSRLKQFFRKSSGGGKDSGEDKKKQGHSPRYGVAASSTISPTPSKGMRRFPHKCLTSQNSQALAAVEPGASTSQRCRNEASDEPQLSTGKTPLGHDHYPSQITDRNAQSLWDRAYATLGTENARLVEKYEKLLSRVLPNTSVYGRLRFRRSR